MTSSLFGLVTSSLFGLVTSWCCVKEPVVAAVVYGGRSHFCADVATVFPACTGVLSVGVLSGRAADDWNADADSEHILKKLETQKASLEIEETKEVIRILGEIWLHTCQPLRNFVTVV